ncbi:MAG: PKD domain-containing protein [Flavobacteriales bacterium]|nr:PKD domain-containing protein [Flavobacteriales bacterium]
MKNLSLILIVFLLFSTNSFSQELSSPYNSTYGDSPIYSTPLPSTKAPGDSCGAYFNNYIGLTKTSTIGIEYLKTGDVSGIDYVGRAQRFYTPQAIEVSGVQFYSYFSDPTVDSIQVIVYLWDWDETLDSVGTELASDTVWVTHTAYTPDLPEVEVNGFFDEPITVTEDYIVGVIAADANDDSLRIYTSSAAAADGAGEAVSFAYYNNPLYPTFEGWYQTLETFGASYDIDYLISPRVKFDLHEGFTVIDDTICPEVVSAGCAEYVQMPIFADGQYNGNSATPESMIVYYWGDGFQNTGLPSACHTYSTPGTYEINLIDTLARNDFFSPLCIVDLTETIVVLGPPTASFGSSSAGLTADFTNTSTGADSVVYDFGDGNSSNLDDPSHTYSSTGTYTVTLIAYNMCSSDTTSMEVVIDDVGVYENNKNFVVYPNPANEQLIVADIEAGSQIEIINLIGQTIYTTSATSSKENMDVSYLPAGTYFVRISGSTDQYTRKFVVRH